MVPSFMQSFIVIFKGTLAREKEPQFFHNVVRLRHYSNMKACDLKNYFYTAIVLLFFETFYFTHACDNSRL
jgi:hypothetical protein